MQVSVDRNKCQGVGMCESVRPDVFELDDDGELLVHDDAVAADALDDLQQAVESCPTQALAIVR